MYDSTRALRPPKDIHDPWRPLGQQIEEERQPDGRRLASRTVFLTGAECPFACVFCDLWRHTTDAPTPRGAIPRQLDLALAEDPTPTPLIKLYNASNFFEKNAVPPADDDEILHRLGGFEKVVVECHARLLSRRAFAFADRLEGRLQVAIGWETVHPRILAMLDKKVTVADLENAGRRLRERGISHRAFLLVGVPGLVGEEDLDWVERSCATALAAGADQVVLIPLRPDRAAGAPWPAPTLEHLEKACRRCAALDSAALLVDLWDLERCPSTASPAARAAIHARLTAFNRDGRWPRGACERS